MGGGFPIFSFFSGSGSFHWLAVNVNVNIIAAINSHLFIINVLKSYKNKLALPIAFSLPGKFTSTADFIVLFCLNSVLSSCLSRRLINVTATYLQEKEKIRLNKIHIDA